MIKTILRMWRLPAWLKGLRILQLDFGSWFILSSSVFSLIFYLPELFLPAMLFSKLLFQYLKSSNLDKHPISWDYQILACQLIEGGKYQYWVCQETLKSPGSRRHSSRFPGWRLSTITRTGKVGKAPVTARHVTGQWHPGILLGINLKWPKGIFHI